MPLFRDWTSILHTAIGTVLAYAFLLLLVRTGGERTLSKENAYGPIITVTLGSTLASIATSSSTPLLKGRPTAVLLQGRFLDTVLTREHVARDEVIAAVRLAGILDLAAVRAVVLETDGSFNVLTEPEGDVHGSSLEDVEGVR